MIAGNGSVQKMGMRTAQAVAVEFVTPGHPDKVCDQMGDAILDAAMAQDPQSRVAMEVTGGHGVVAVIGEMTTTANIDIGKIVREKYQAIGYLQSIGVFVNVVKQSPDIDGGVGRSFEQRAGSNDPFDTQGAGDQGIMVGYAINNLPDYMPQAWSLAKRLAVALVAVRTQFSYLSPDGKSQVTMVDGRVTHVTLAANHLSSVLIEQVRADLLEHVIKPIIPLEGVTVIINGGGAWCLGGFEADAGTTGRKLMVDNYGPLVEVGGGCFSGKDPSKVDRSAAYYCRHVAKSIVAGGHASEALVKVGYALGAARPTFLSVQTPLPDHQNAQLRDKVLATFDFRPKAIIKQLGLLEPKGWLFQDTAAAGHFGDLRFPWEQVAEL